MTESISLNFQRIIYQQTELDDFVEKLSRRRAISDTFTDDQMV